MYAAGHMGTAPDDRQQPAMPAPERLVTRSVGLLEQLGIGRYQALSTVAVVARRAKTDLESIGIDGLDWLEQIAATAEIRLAVPAPPITDHEGNEHGNRGGS